MEDRKKVIRDLEARKAETQESLDVLLEKLGESLIIRLDGGDISVDLPVPGASGDHPQGLSEEKAKHTKEIADSRDAIKNIEANLSRLGELEEIINRKEQENAEKHKEIVQLYTKLGQIILEDSRFEEFTLPFKSELDDITINIDFQKKKLEELENAEGGFFSKVANGARSMVTKSLLVKYQSTLEKLHRNAGEHFMVSREKAEHDSEIPADGQASELIESCEKLRAFSASLKEEITNFRNERKECAGALDQGGNPTRRISDLEKYIARIEDDIRKIHRRFGFCIRQNDYKDIFSAYFSDADKILDDKINALEDLIAETDKKIEKTKISIAIDNEKADIEKLKETIAERERLIADANTAIAECNENITEAEKAIEKLQDQYDKIK